MSLDDFIDVRYRRNDTAISHMKSLLSELGVECARTIEEKVDLQFDALRNLHHNLKDDTLFIRLVIANSIVSYQLSGKGEDWWWEFSRYFSAHPPSGSIRDAYAEFLPRSRTNRRLVAGKLKRLERLEPFLEGLDREKSIKYYTEGMGRLRAELAGSLGSRKSAKTVVFAVKMFGYAGRIAFGEFVPYPMEIEIPDDVRIKAYTERFTTEKPVVFWRRVSDETGIPPLHIDSILWPVLGGKDEVLRRLEERCPKAGLVLELREL